MTFSHGLKHGTIRLVLYDSLWPALFEQEAALIRSRLEQSIGDIAHIGSTAVPGLAAKPIIDLMMAIPALRAPRQLFDALSEIGYEHRPLDTLAERLFFAKELGNLRTHNLSVCETNSPFWVSRLRFRDRLRSDQELARSYAELKQALAAQFPDDRLGYTNSKEQFIAAAIA